MRVALRTQQIIAYESGVTDTVDPLAGSYYIECLTNLMEEEATKYIDKIDSMGGAVAAIEKGYVQKEIVESAYKHQREVENKERIVVGVNEFAVKKEAPIKILRVDPEVERKQTERLDAIKKRRNNEKVRNALNHLRHCAEGDENLMPSILLAVKEYATLGEICDVLREIFGIYKAPTIF